MSGMTYRMHPLMEQLNDTIQRLLEMVDETADPTSPERLEYARRIAEVVEILMRARRQA